MLLTTTTSKDPICGRLVVEFKDGANLIIPGARHVSEVVLTSGPSGSYATVPIPVKAFGPAAFDRVAPEVALQRDGPAGTIKLRTPATVYALVGSTSVPVFNGYAVSITHELRPGEDSIIVELYDARWVLGKITTFGCLVWDPSLNTLHWDLARRKVYNHMGYPDCLDHPTFGPVFAPCHRFGYKNDFSPTSIEDAFEDYDEPAVGQATTRARSWRGADAIRDLYNAHVAGVQTPARKVDLGELTLPANILWTKSLGSAFKRDRPLRDFDITGMSLLDAFQSICRKAGSYDIGVDYQDNGVSELKIIDESAKANTGYRLVTPDYASGIGECVNSVSVIKSGHVRESFINGFDSTAIIGDAPAVEVFVTMPAEVTNGFPVGLEAAWSDEDEIAFRNYVARYGTSYDGNQTSLRGTQYSFAAACKKWPLVYCAYRIKGSFNPFEGTKWNGYKNGGYPRIKPFQLTGYQQNQSNPRNWCPREIAVEYCMQNSDAVDPSGLNNVPAAYNPNNVWREAARYDNLTLSADGTMVFLTGLRDTTNADGAQSWVSQRTGRDDGNGNWSQEENNAYRGDTLRKRPLRMQLAIEGDWPIVALAGRGGTKASDPNRIYDRVQNGPKFCWQVVAPPGDYVEYLRHEKSRPIGQGPISSINDFRSNIAFPTKCVEGDELFTDRVNNETGRQPEHAKARLQDVKRVEVSAQLEIQALAPCHKPGITYTLEGPNTIPVYGVARTVILRSNPQSDLQGQTTICLEPPEFEGLYNSSLGRSGSAKAPSNAGSGYASVSFSDPYADYQSKTPQQQTSTPPQTSGSDSGYAYGGTANAALAGAMGGAGAGKQVSNKAAEGRAGNAQRAKNAASMAADARKAGNIEQAEKHEKAARKLAANAENFEQNKAGKEEQRANRGSFTTADGRTMKAGDNFMGGGRNTAGSMTYANGQRVEAGELDKNAAGMINTQAVDKYIENQPRRKEGLSGNGGKALATPEERAAAGMSVGNRGSMSKTGKANTPAISIGASPRPKATGETRAQKFAREQAETFARANQPDKPLFNTKAPDRSAAKAREQMEADMEGGQKL